VDVVVAGGVADEVEFDVLDHVGGERHEHTVELLLARVAHAVVEHADACELGLHGSHQRLNAGQLEVRTLFNVFEDVLDGQRDEGHLVLLDHEQRESNQVGAELQNEPEARFLLLLVPAHLYQNRVDQLEVRVGNILADERQQNQLDAELHLPLLEKQ